MGHLNPLLLIDVYFAKVLTLCITTQVPMFSAASLLEH
jgi:hypothetical protein